jgi:acetyl esterase/lipase
MRLTWRRRARRSPVLLSRGIERLEPRSLLSSDIAPQALTVQSRQAAEIRASAIANPALRTPSQANVPYEDVGGRIETLDVYQPSGPAPAGGWPVLMAIHGGGWRKFSKEEYGPNIAAQFTPHGYVVVAMDYLLSSPFSPSWPANFQDVQNSLRWVRSNASELGINPNEIGAIGESAGGNLAALLGTVQSAGASGSNLGGVSTQVQAVVDFYGPSDLTALVESHARGGPAAVQFLGGTPAQVPALYAAASPIDHVSHTSAPMLILQGTSDTIVPLGQSQELAQALTSAGVPNRLITVPGASHGFEFQHSGLALVPQVVEFLNSTLKNESAGP